MNNIEDKTFSFAGTLWSGDRYYLRGRLKPLGAGTRNHVSSQVNILVVGKNPGNAQLRLAEEHDTVIWSEIEFINAVEEAEKQQIGDFVEADIDIDWYSIINNNFYNPLDSAIVPSIDNTRSTYHVWDIQAANFYQLDNLDGLESLSYNTDTKEDIETFLTSLHLLPNLKALEISNYGDIRDMPISISRILDALPQLQCLIISGVCKLGFDVTRHTALRWLAIRRNKITNGLEYLSLPKLHHLEVDNFSVKDIQAILNQAAFPKLHSIGVYSSRNKVAKKLQLLTLPNHITELVLNNDKSGNDDLKRLARHPQISQIKHLHIRSWAFSWPSVINTSLLSLRSITLHSCPEVYDKEAGLREFEEFLHSLPLNEDLMLCMAYCHLSSDYLTVLYRVLKETPIRSLDISRNPSNNKQLHAKFDRLPFPVDYRHPDVTR